MMPPDQAGIYRTVEALDIKLQQALLRIRRLEEIAANLTRQPLPPNDSNGGNNG